MPLTRPVFALTLVSLTAFAACGSTPASSNDAGAPRVDASADGGASGTVSSFCANARRLGCAGASGCEAMVNQIIAASPARCRALVDAYLACAQRAGAASCYMGPPSQCAAEDDAVSRCANPADGSTAPGDAVVEDAAATDKDAGAAEEDAPPACPDIAGRYTAMTALGRPDQCPLGQVTFTRHSEGACRYLVQFRNDSMETFTLSSASIDVSPGRTVRGAGTIVDAEGTRAVVLEGRIGDVPGDRFFRQSSPDGPTVCDWGLSPEP